MMGEYKPHLKSRKREIKNCIIGKHVCGFRISHLLMYKMNIYCCCLQKKVNKLMKIQNYLEASFQLVL